MFELCCDECGSDKVRPVRNAYEIYECLECGHYFDGLLDVQPDKKWQTYDDEEW